MRKKALGGAECDEIVRLGIERLVDVIHLIGQEGKRSERVNSLASSPNTSKNNLGCTKSLIKFKEEWRQERLKLIIQNEKDCGQAELLREFDTMVESFVQCTTKQGAQPPELAPLIRCWDVMMKDRIRLVSKSLIEYILKAQENENTGLRFPRLHSQKLASGKEECSLVSEMPLKSFLSMDILVGDILWVHLNEKELTHYHVLQGFLKSSESIITELLDGKEPEDINILRGLGRRARARRRAAEGRAARALGRAGRRWARRRARARARLRAWLIREHSRRKEALQRERKATAARAIGRAWRRRRHRVLSRPHRGRRRPVRPLGDCCSAGPAAAAAAAGAIQRVWRGALARVRVVPGRRAIQQAEERRRRARAWERFRAEQAALRPLDGAAVRNRCAAAAEARRARGPEARRERVGMEAALAAFEREMEQKVRAEPLAKGRWVEMQEGGGYLNLKTGKVAASHPHAGHARANARRARAAAAAELEERLGRLARYADQVEAAAEHMEGLLRQEMTKVRRSSDLRSSRSADDFLLL